VLSLPDRIGLEILPAFAIRVIPLRRHHLHLRLRGQRAPYQLEVHHGEANPVDRRLASERWLGYGGLQKRMGWKAHLQMYNVRIWSGILINAKS
jgi:hypothetical protein